jgi:N utilization substance protein A
MATKKKSKKQTKSKKAAGKKPIKKTAQKLLASKRRMPPVKKLAKKAAPKKTAKRKKPVALKKKRREESNSVDSVAFAPAGSGAQSGGQSGDLQGLSNIPSADSESVDELIEEGNAFEAEAVQGVENALDPDQGEVRTHEAPEDDVPKEYDEQQAGPPRVA